LIVEIILFEVEVKILLKNRDDTEKKLKSLGGHYIISLIHEDTYFNMPKKLRNFYRTDEALRIRKSFEFDKFEDSPKKRTDFITYKGAKIDDSTKTRKEVDVKVADGDKIIEILKILGFREVYTVKKERELFGIEYSSEMLEVLLDYLPDLDQHFMEVESQAEKEDDIALKRENIFNFLSKISNDKEESIRKSYLELIIDKIQHKNS